MDVFHKGVVADSNSGFFPAQFSPHRKIRRQRAVGLHPIRIQRGLVLIYILRKIARRVGCTRAKLISQLILTKVKSSADAALAVSRHLASLRQRDPVVLAKGCQNTVAVRAVGLYVHAPVDSDIITTAVNPYADGGHALCHQRSVLKNRVPAAVNVQAHSVGVFIVSAGNIGRTVRIAGIVRRIVHDGPAVAVHGTPEEIPPVDGIPQILQYRQFRFHKAHIISPHLVAHPTVAQFDMAKIDKVFAVKSFISVDRQPRDLLLQLFPIIIVRAQFRLFQHISHMAAGKIRDGRVRPIIKIPGQIKIRFRLRLMVYGSDLHARLRLHAAPVIQMGFIQIRFFGKTRQGQFMSPNPQRMADFMDYRRRKGHITDLGQRRIIAGLFSIRWKQGCADNHEAGRTILRPQGLPVIDNSVRHRDADGLPVYLHVGITGLGCRVIVIVIDRDSQDDRLLCGLRMLQHAFPVVRSKMEALLLPVRKLALRGQVNPVLLKHYFIVPLTRNFFPRAVIIQTEQSVRRRTRCDGLRPVPGRKQTKPQGKGRQYGFLFSPGQVFFHFESPPTK